MNPIGLAEKNHAKARARGPKVLFFLSGTNRCGVPISRVVRILKYQAVTTLPKSADYVMGMMNLQGKILPVLDFAKRITGKRFEPGDNACIVILQAERDGRHLALGIAVESVLGVVDVAQEDIQDPPAGLDGIDSRLVRGILGKNDDLRLIIDVDSICGAKDWDIKHTESDSTTSVA